MGCKWFLNKRRLSVIYLPLGIGLHQPEGAEDWLQLSAHPLHRRQQGNSSFFWIEMGKLIHSINKKLPMFYLKRNRMHNSFPNIFNKYESAF